MKSLIILLLLTNLISAQVEKKVLAQGSSYNWRIEVMTDNKETATYFYMTSRKTKNSNGLYIGIPSIEELKQFVGLLKYFGSYTGTKTIIRGSEQFVLLCSPSATKIVLSDLNGGYLLLSRTSAKSLSTELENKIILWE